MESPRTAVVLQAYRYALDPTSRQEAALASHTGACRFAYNWDWSLSDSDWRLGRPGRLSRCPWTLFELRREWNQAKHEVAPWWPENSKEAYSSGLHGLARALKNWKDSRQGSRRGKPTGFPRRKRKGNVTESCRFTTGAIYVEADRHHVTLPRLGRIHTHESTRKLARRLERGSARIMAATITRRGGRWFVSFTCQVERTVVSRRPRATIGVDVGIRHLAVLSDGRMIPNPAPLLRAQRRLRRLDRQLARRRGPRAADGAQRHPSTGWRHTRQQLVRAHTRVANVRHNSLHQFTSDLVETYGTIVIERLNVAGLLKSRRLARRLADASLGKLRRQLAYKTTWAGSTLVEADRFFPSSKICSECGYVKAKLSLSDRQYRCECCGVVLDRDVNAARNLALLVDSSTNRRSPGVAWRLETPVDGDSGPGILGSSSMKREAGAESLGLGQTGTAGW